MILVVDIQRAVAAEFDVPLYTMTAKSNRGEGHNGENRWEISRARQVAMYLAKQLTRHSKSHIGRLFGGRDHTTILHAIRATEERMAKSKVLRKRVEKLRESFSSPPVDIPSPIACEQPRRDSLECPMEKKTKPDWYVKQAQERCRPNVGYTTIMRIGCHEPKVREEDRVYRDPCIRCGVRGDIGCIHTRVAA